MPSSQQWLPQGSSLHSGRPIKASSFLSFTGDWFLFACRFDALEGMPGDGVMLKWATNQGHDVARTRESVSKVRVGGAVPDMDVVPGRKAGVLVCLHRGDPMRLHAETGI